MQDFRAVEVDVEKVRRQMSDELNRPVADVELAIWLRQCGAISYSGRWMTITRPHGSGVMLPVANPQAAG